MTKPQDQLSAHASTDLLDQIINAVNMHMLERVDAMLSALPNSLTLRGCPQNLCTFATEQNRAIHQAFFVALNQHLTSPAEEIDELALVDEEEMATMMVASSVMTAAMKRYGNAVDHLEARLEYLSISGTISAGKNVLNPDQLCEVYVEALRGFTLEPVDMRILLDLFGQQVILPLESMYKDINALLIDADVMPDIVMETKHDYDPEQKSDVQISMVRTENTQNSVAEYAIERSESDLAYMASIFMSKDYIAPADAIHLPESFKRPVEEDADDEKRYFRRKDVMRALSRLQKNDYARSSLREADTIEDIKGNLVEDIRTENDNDTTRQVSTLDERSIDFVGMLFDEISQDENITTVTKNLIMRLQIPVIKVAMSDNELFQNDEHPTRVLLDNMVEAGNDITDIEDRRYIRLEQVVDELLLNYNIELDCFDGANVQIRTLIDKDKREAATRERREHQAARLSFAREMITDEVKRATSGKKIPKELIPLISRHMPTAMIRCYLKRGHDAWEWQSQLQLFRLLMTSMQSIDDAANWRCIWDNHAHIIDAIEEVLTQAGSLETGGIGEQVTLLRDAFAALLDDFEMDEEVATKPKAEVHHLTVVQEDDEQAELRLKERLERAQEKIDALPDNVKIGAWYEVFNGEDRALRRLKLSAIIEETAMLVFVDRQGNTVLQKEAGVFRDEIRARRSSAIYDHSPFEAALGKVINSLAA